MSEEVEMRRDEAERGLVLVFVFTMALILLSVLLRWFDKTTELAPNHNDVLRFCFFIAGLGGVACGVISIRKSKKLAVWRRIPILCCLTLMGFLGAFSLSSQIANLVEMRIDFPPGKSRTYPALLVIWRAYRTQGKGQSWNIQTAPIWSNLDVTRSDYEFMLAHRGPKDQGRNPDEISSHGFFCARVMVQQSGSAFRVLNAGSQKLPAGTVIVCPTTPVP